MARRGLIAVRAPDHLGDAVMALPAIEALAALGAIRVHTRGRWGAELFYGHDVRPGDEAPEADVGVLLKPSMHAAWRWRHLPRRVGVGPLLTDDVGDRAEHRRDRYARIVGALGVEARGQPRYAPRGTSPDLPESFVGLNPWSPSAAVRWPGFAALAAQVARPVFFAGPGEGAPVREIAGDNQVIEGLSLPDFAAALDRCRVFVTNDSGAGHFAAACGTRVVMLHGSTTAARTGAGEAIEGPELFCRPCYLKRCPLRLGCLRGIPVARVLEQIA